MNNCYKCNQTPPTFLPNIRTLRMLITVQRNLHASVSLCMHPNSSAESMAKITKRLCTLVLRLMAVAATLLAAIVMVTSHQRTSIYGVSFEVKYNHTPAFQYFVIANAIATVYGFLVLFLPSESQLWRLVVALDVVITVLLSTSFSAALAIGDVGKHGNSYAGWQPICGQVPKYCDQVKAALISSFVGLIIYLLLLLYAIHTVLDPLLLKKT